MEYEELKDMMLTAEKSGEVAYYTEELGKCKPALHEDLSCSNGQYDIHYVINLVKQIENKCHEMRLNPKELQFTLAQSCKTLRVKLEMERDFKQDARVRTYRCDQCQEMYFVPSNMQGECPECLKDKPKRISRF